MYHTSCEALTTVEQHGFELHRFTSIHIFFKKYIGKCLDICDNLKKHKEAREKKVRMQYNIHITYNTCVVDIISKAFSQ